MTNRGRTAGWIVLWACLIASLYIPGLSTQFDFNDDGNLVYPSGAATVEQHLRLYRDRVLGEYHSLGVFRPVLLAHWQVGAQVLGANAFRWRLARTVWAALAAGAMLTLMLQLRIRPAAAVLATAVALWSPEQGEVWRALTLSEGVAMPYALAGLICAVAAARSARPTPWDMAGALFVLAALGCKNTFAAIVPAQMLLRIAPDGLQLRQAWRRHGRRAAALGLTLLLPAGHFIIYKSAWHPGQYATAPPDPGQLITMARGMIKESIFLMVPAALSIAALLTVGKSASEAAQERRRDALVQGLRRLWRDYRGAWLVGLLLLGAGIAIYLPVRLRNPGGRYAIPAAWGGDLWFAALLSGLIESPASAMRRVAVAAAALGVGALAIASLAAQQRFAARARCLWRALETVGTMAPPERCIAWVYGPELARGEGIHFIWHLRARGHPLRLALIDAGSGRIDELSEHYVGIPICRRPAIVVSGRRADAPPGFAAAGTIEVPYWFGLRRYDCYLWRAAPAAKGQRRGSQSSSAPAGGAISLAATLIGTSREPSSPSWPSSM